MSLPEANSAGQGAGEEPSAFGKLLRRHREIAGLSQEELAERANMSVGAIGALERGERRHPYPHTVQLLATALALDETQRTALVAAIGPRRGSTSATNRAGGAGFTSATFVGRSSELGLLRSCLADALAGGGSVVMLVGEAGIGKTRLARALAEDAQAHGALMLWGRCFEGEWQPPYGPWVEVLREYAHGRDPDRLRRELGPGAAPVARLVSEIDAALPDLPLPSTLSPDEARYRLYDAVVQLLLTLAAERPVVIVLDDLHWAEGDSLLLLRHLARFVERAPILLVGAYREPDVALTDEHPLLGALAALRRESDYQRIPLSGFTHDEVAIFLSQTAGQVLPTRLVSAIADETNGNPFYAREILRHLGEQVERPLDDESWSDQVSFRQLGVPEGVRRVVGQRVARLSVETGNVLALASGLSGTFGFDVLAALSGLTEDELLDCLDEALRAGLVRVRGGLPPRYEFAHAIVRHALYEGFNPDRRARLHRRIALAMESTHPGNLPEIAAELAAQYHASAALPGAEPGLPYALTSAEQARAAFAHDQAVGFLLMARDLARSTPASQRAEIQCRLAVAQAEAVKLAEARESADEALDMMLVAGVGTRARAEFVTTIARVLKDGGADNELWEPLVERGLALAGEQHDLVWARLELLRDRIEPMRSGPISGGQWLGLDSEAVSIARADGDEEDYARTLEPLDWRTREQTDAVLAEVSTWTRPLAVMRGLDVAGRDLIYRHGAFDEALAVYRRMLEVSQRFGSIHGQAEAMMQVGASQLALGALQSAEQDAARAREIIARLGVAHRLHYVATGSSTILAYFLDGDWPLLAELSARYATSPDTARSPVAILAASHAALSLTRAGKPERAREMLQHFTSAVEHMAPTSYSFVTAVPLAAAVVWELQATEFAPTYRRFVSQLKRVGMGDHYLGPLDLSLARMAALMGEHTGAQADFFRARSTLDRRGLSHVRGIVDYDLAGILQRSDSPDQDRITELLESALDAFRAHLMLGWVNRAERRAGASQA